MRRKLSAEFASIVQTQDERLTKEWWKVNIDTTCLTSTF